MKEYREKLGVTMTIRTGQALKRPHREAYATSHVGWGMNPAARWDVLALYDRRELWGTEVRAFAGNFLYSTGANETAGRFTAGHFDLPMRHCSVTLDGSPVVTDGRLIADLAEP